MYDFNDGCRAEIDRDNIAVKVYDDPDLGCFVVSGFSSLQNAESFITFGDLSTAGKDNAYLMIKKTDENLIWTSIK